MTDNRQPSDGGPLEEAPRVWGCAYWPDRMPNDDQLARRSDEEPWFVGFFLDGRLARAAWVASQEDAVELAEQVTAPVSLRRDEAARSALETWQTVQDGRDSLEADQQWYLDYLAGRTTTYPSDG